MFFFSLYIYEKLSSHWDRQEGIQKNVLYQGILEFNTAITISNYISKFT